MVGGSLEESSCSLENINHLKSIQSVPLQGILFRSICGIQGIRELFQYDFFWVTGKFSCLVTAGYCMDAE